MNILDFYNLYIKNNKELIYFLLQSIKKCISNEHIDKYANQIECINKIQWVLDVEVDLYFDNNLCKKYLIHEWEQEKVIAKATIIDKNDKKYSLNFFVVNGRIFSIESNLPFRYLLVKNIKDFQVICK